MSAWYIMCFVILMFVVLYSCIFLMCDSFIWYSVRRRITGNQFYYHFADSYIYVQYSRLYWSMLRRINC